MPATQTQLERLLKHAQSRNTRSRWGIGVASTYLRQLESCFEGGACPAAHEGMTKNAYQAMIKRAEETITWCQPKMGVKGFRQPDTKELTDIPGAIMMLDCIITSSKRDRDHDILEPTGAKVDLKQALLWQHDSFYPIGRMVELLTPPKSKLYLPGRFAIIDNVLGRDAAYLVENGVLRISHGFQPEEYDPLTEKQGGEEVFTGWHIKVYEIMETSLVSVPSNTDAVITAWERAKLHHPLTKRWGEKMFRARPPQGRGMDLPGTAKDAAPACTCGAKSHATPNTPAADKQGFEPLATVVTKAAVDSIKDNGKPSMQKSLYISSLEGSWEWVREKLQASLGDHLRTTEDGFDAYRESAYVESLFSDYALICIYRGWDNQKLYKLGWSLVDGMPTWSGEPSEVELAVELVDKDLLPQIKGFQGIRVKQCDVPIAHENPAPEFTAPGRARAFAQAWIEADEKSRAEAVDEIELILQRRTFALFGSKSSRMSKATASKLTDACELLTEACDRSDMTKGAKALIKAAHANIIEVLPTDADEIADGDAPAETGEKLTLDLLMRHVTVAVAESGTDQYETLFEFHRAIGRLLVIKQGEFDNEQKAKAEAEADQALAELGL